MTSRVTVSMHPLQSELGLRGPADVMIVVLGGLLGGVCAFLQEHGAGVVVAVTALTTLLAACAVADMRERRIPNLLTYSGTAGAFAAAAARGGPALQGAVLGFLLAGGIFLALFILGRGRLGMGDVKLSALAGATLGFDVIPSFLLLSSMFGVLAGAVVWHRTRERGTLFAFGPCLSAAAAVHLIVNGPVFR